MEFEILSFKKISSTQDLAKKLAKEGKKPWTVILAEEQKKGHGRREGKFWYSPKGGLYFSVILPKSKIEDLQSLTILAAFVIAKIIKENFNLEPFIKLPNDVWVNGKKIAGILTENVILGQEVKSSVMGIGVNTNIGKFPKKLENIATSLKIELGKEVNNQKILNQFLQGLKEKLKTISK
ncbi:MAG: biotin--[acetyl-CoA-carboxylase] ligase [Patescibacteria group bacterium]|nr:biotin--[acetyl-CoA-carboxylase] ligase [Patescibacteria group bacterium]